MKQTRIRHLALDHHHDHDGPIARLWHQTAVDTLTVGGTPGLALILMGWHPQMWLCGWRRARFQRLCHVYL